jgi:hypothetical protein
VKALIKVLKIDPKDESKKTKPTNNKSIKDIDKARGIRKALTKIYYD